MDLINCEKITKKEINYINKKKEEGLTLSQIITETLPSDTAKEDIKTKTKNFSRRLNRAGYRVIDEMYVQKNNEEIKATILKTPEKSIINENKKTRKKYVTKKQKEKELEEKRIAKLEELKFNPYGLSIEKVCILNAADDIYCEIEQGFKGQGVYLLPEVIKRLKLVTTRFNYIPHYFFENIAVKYTSTYIDEFKNSIWIDEFSKLILDEKINKTKEDRMQRNIKFSREILNNNIPIIENEFPFLSKSDLVNMCIFAYCNCVINALNLDEK